ncbi:MAG: hypothetical protein WD036_09090 [Bauldia sp.]
MDQFRRFVIKTAEIFVVAVVVLMTLSFAISGWMMGNGVIGFLVGGVFGFVLSAVIAATFFLLEEIAENTRTSRME